MPTVSVARVHTAFEQPLETYRTISPRDAERVRRQLPAVLWPLPPAGSGPGGPCRRRPARPFRDVASSLAGSHRPVPLRRDTGQGHPHPAPKPQEAPTMTQVIERVRRRLEAAR